MVMISRMFFFSPNAGSNNGATYLGVALGEKVAPGGLFEAICEDENKRKVTLSDEWR